MSNLLDLEKAIVKFYQDIEQEIEINSKFCEDNQHGSKWDQTICFNLHIENKCLVKQRNSLFEVLWHFGIDPRMGVGEKK